MHEHACINLERVTSDLNIHERRGMMNTEERGVTGKALGAKNAHFHRVAVLHNLQARDEGIADEITIEYFRATLVENLAVDQGCRPQRGEKHFVFGFGNSIEDVIAASFPAVRDWDLRRHGDLKKLGRQEWGSAKARFADPAQQGLETSLFRVREPAELARSNASATESARERI